MPILKLLWLFFISMVPVIELRGAVILGAAEAIPWYETYIACVVGNILPVPFILLLVPYVLDFLGKFRFFRPFVTWLREKADKNSRKIFKDGTTGEEHGKKIFTPDFFGLLFFVAIPCPGTGAWTGSLVASLFSMPKRRALLAVSLGVLLCGVIMILAAYGVVGFLDFLL